MASSDDEAEALLVSVSNYDFADYKDEPVSFSALPILWDEKEKVDERQEKIFLRGTTDNGLQKVFKQVIGWRFDLCNVNPEFFVISKENTWIRLHKPRKSFEDIIRTTLITVSCLHFLKKNPETIGKPLWDHLSKIFSTYEVRPSANDLMDQMSLISETVERDEDLAKTKFLHILLEGKSSKLKLADEDMHAASNTSFIVDDSDEDIGEDAEDDENDDDVFDSVCAFCDNGGDILCCEGRCLRSFHATEEAGEESLCASLGFSPEEVERIENFFCKNCQSKQHQCFVCGKLGSSEKSSGAEVFPCVNATCGYFYHPRCIAKLLHRDSKVAAEELEKNIAAGESFTCPIHKCCVCKQGENKRVYELQFAVCRRCPKAYHRKCLPWEIALDDPEEKGITIRAWEDLLPNRILIYCLNHELLPKPVGTPVRDHIKFPGLEGKNYVIRKKASLDGKKLRTSDGIGDRKKVVEKNTYSSYDDIFEGKTAVRKIAAKGSKLNENSYSLSKLAQDKPVESLIRASDSFRRIKGSMTSNRSFKDNMKSASTKLDKSPMNKPSLGYRLFSFMAKRDDQVKPRKQDVSDPELGMLASTKSLSKKLSSELLSLDEDAERRILDLMEDAASSVSWNDIVEKHKVPSTHAHSIKNVVERTITMGKLEGSVDGIRAALKKLEDGCSIEDAEAVCEPVVLTQFYKWKNKLKVYLSPFLHGMRYTSFGRHFTKVEKLQEIVDKLHWYVQSDDMVVDFCCGANDFSILMKKKLEDTGKKCFYKNYDFIPPKNDFNFEKRDWMTVEPNELPTGSKLIMGLNPPFGVKAALANKFVDKALQFNPKLIILIVPPETERLDKKVSPYDLVWEDDHFLSGKSFYLPGSVDANDKQMDQWNVRPPLLYLWSRHDWTAKHKVIAQKHGHLQEEELELKNTETSDIQKPAESPRLNDKPNLGDDPLQARPEDFRDKVIGTESHKGVSSHYRGDGERPETLGTESHKGVSSHYRGDGERPETLGTESHKGVSSHYRGDGERPETRRQLNVEVGEKSRKRRRGRGRVGQRMDDLLDDDKQNSRRPHADAKCEEFPNFTPNALESRSSMEGVASKSVDMPQQHNPQHLNNPQQPESYMYGSNLQFSSSYGGLNTTMNDEFDRRYGEDPYLIDPVYGLPGIESPGSYYGARNFDEPFMGRIRGMEEVIGYRANVCETEDRYRKDIRSQIRLYGQQNPEPSRTNYLEGQDSGYDQMGSLPPTYGQMGSESSSYRSGSAMQRYAPRLDELNHTRIPSFGLSSQMGRDGMADYRHPPPSYRGSVPPGGVPPIGTPPFPSGPPSRPFYPYHNSPGWLNE